LKGYEYGLMLLSALGAVLIAFSRKSASGPQPTVTGDLLVFVSMFAALVMILISKRLMADYGSLQVTAAMLVIGTAILLLWTEVTHPVRIHFSTRVWLAVIAQGLLATTGAYVFWNWGLARVPAARAGVFLNLEPLIGTLLGIAILHESLGTVGILGGAMILSSAAYFSRRSGSGTISG
jgi:drug/metabolite transporter (DMT)-like permease